jgi:hypothetical protein
MRITFILMFIPITAFAEMDCNELAQELLETQVQLEATPLHKCGKTGENDIDKADKIYCYEPEDGDGGNLTLPQAQRDYEAKLAAVTMLEGLAGIAMGIEDNHHALSTITEEELTTAKNKMYQFMNLFTKGEALQLALDVDEDEGFILQGYKGDANHTELSSFLENKCKGESFGKFCEFYKGLKDNEVESVQHSLHGFAGAYNASSEGMSDLNLLQQFPEYKAYLNIRYKDKNGTLSDYKSSDEFQKLEQYKTLLDNYDPQKTTNEQKKEILTLANSLYQVDLSYGNQLDGLDSREKKVFDQQLGNAMTSLELSAANVLTFNRAEKNLNELEEAFTNKLAELTQSMALDKDKKDITANLADEQVRLNDQLDIIKDIKECFPKNDPEAAKATIEEQKRKKKVIQACYQEKLNEGFYKKFGVSSDLSEARKELAKAANRRGRIQSGTPVKQLFQKKVVLINLIKNSESCGKFDQVNELNSVCRTSMVDNFSQNVVQFGDIIVTYNAKRLDDLMNLTSEYKFVDNNKSKGKKEAMDFYTRGINYYKTAAENCDPEKDKDNEYCVYVSNKIIALETQVQNLDKSYVRDKNKKIRKTGRQNKRDINKRVRERVRANAEAEGGTGYVAGGVGIAAGFGQVLPSAFQSWMYVDNYKTYNQNYMDWVLYDYDQRRHQNAWYEATLRYYNQNPGEYMWNFDQIYNFDYNPAPMADNPNYNNGIYTFDYGQNV